MSEKVASSSEFTFMIEFIDKDSGGLFKLGPCCGDSGEPVTELAYTVRKINGVFKVMELPVYVP